MTRKQALPAGAAVVFDLDGTLIDSIPAVTEATNRVLADLGRPPLATAAVREMVGHGARATLVRALAASGGGERDEGLVSRCMERYLDAYLDDPAAATVIYPGVLEVLEDLTAAGVPLGICTNKPGPTTRPVLAALGLARYFKAVVTADDTPHRKPDGRHLLETLAAMEAAPACAAYVGDSETDVEAGRNAGLPVVAVTWGYAHGAIQGLGADALIDRFDQLPAALVRLLDRGGR